MVKQKRLPRPDRLMKGAARVAKDKLSLDLDTECTLKKRPVTSDEAKMQTSHAPAVAYEVKNKNSAKNCSSELTFLPQQSVVLHGVDGMVNNMFYYYIPRCSVKGSIFLDGEEHEAGAHSQTRILVIPLARSRSSHLCIYRYLSLCFLRERSARKPARSRVMAGTTESLEVPRTTPAPTRWTRGHGSQCNSPTTLSSPCITSSTKIHVMPRRRLRCTPMAVASDRFLR